MTYASGSQVIVAEEREFTLDVGKEAVKAAVTGAGTGSIFGLIGALLYSSGTATAYRCLNGNIVEPGLLGRPPSSDCSAKIVSMGPFDADSAVNAAVVFGVPIAVAVALIAFVAF